MGKGNRGDPELPGEGPPNLCHRTSPTGGILWRPYASLGAKRTDDDDDDENFSFFSKFSLIFVIRCNNP